MSLPLPGCREVFKGDTCDSAMRSAKSSKIISEPMRRSDWALKPAVIAFYLASSNSLICRLLEPAADPCGLWGFDFHFVSLYFFLISLFSLVRFISSCSLCCSAFFCDHIFFSWCFRWWTCPGWKSDSTNKSLPRLHRRNDCCDSWSGMFWEKQN